MRSAEQISICVVQFDKDDTLAVEFVTAAANLRAACYNIPQQSLFDTKVRVLPSRLSLKRRAACQLLEAGLRIQS